MSSTIDPKGRFVVYEADQDTDEVVELYRADPKTGQVLKLSAPLPTGRDVLRRSSSFDPTGRFVVYTSIYYPPKDPNSCVLEHYLADLNGRLSVKDLGVVEIEECDE